MTNILYIITPSRFLQCFTEFIIHKQNLKFIVNTYMVENIGNGTFNDIKDFLDAESEKIQDDYYVILGGDGTLVPGKFESYPSKGFRITDSAYACNDKGTLWRSVGRFPASNENQIKRMCANVISYETGTIPYKGDLLMIAATTDNINKSKALISSRLTTISNKTQCYNDTEGSKQIISYIQTNKYHFINFMGHGISDAWVMKIITKDPLEIDSVTKNDIANLQINQAHILSWACNTADVGSRYCLGTAFLNQGAVSFWGACAASWGTENRNMADDFWTAYTDSTCPYHIGDIYLMLYKKYLINKQNKGCNRYMLLGDPTLKIR